ncbi:MAG: hypothetical protein JOZ32_19080 [Bryobacterales bacterium]|nr:hypothetical protein [Bryobacterales bacterium]
MTELETEKLKKLKAERTALDARIRQEQQKLNEKARKQDNHRKILQGACAEEWARRDSEFAARFMKEMDAFVTRNEERVLFGLTPLPNPKK